MSNIDKEALREAAEKAGADEWRAFIDTKSKTYAVHTPGDNRCGDIVKWAGFDGQQKAANKARFIAAANPATVLSLLDELEAADRRNAEQADIIAKQEKWINGIEAAMISAAPKCE
ncbi:TPA: ead/Ea22-like family protein [Escherichia coli]|nr:ead/Ea22-like family protein [Escherichia coli]